MTTRPPDDPDHDSTEIDEIEIKEINVFLLTDSDVLAQDGGTSLWRSVARPVDDAPAAPTPAQLRNLKRMHPAYQDRLFRADGPAKSPPAHAAGTRKMEIYDPLTSSWSAVPPGAGRAQVGEAVCCILPDGRFLIGAWRRQAAPPTTPVRIAGPPHRCVPPARARPVAAAAPPP